MQCVLLQTKHNAMNPNLKVHTLDFGLKSPQAQSLHHKQSFDPDFKVQNIKILVSKPKSQIFVCLMHA